MHALLFLQIILSIAQYTLNKMVKLSDESIFFTYFYFLKFKIMEFNEKKKKQNNTKIFLIDEACFCILFQ